MGSLLIIVAIVVIVIIVRKNRKTASPATNIPVNSAVIDEMIQTLAVLIELAEIAQEDGERGICFYACSVRGNSIQFHFQVRNSHWSYQIRHWNERVFDFKNETYKEFFEEYCLAAAIMRVKSKGIPIERNTLDELNILIKIDPDSADQSTTDDLLLFSSSTILNNVSGYCSALKAAIEKTFPDNLREDAKTRLRLFI